MGNYATSGEKAYYIKLTKENKLGEGNYGEVYKITRKENQKICAAKFFKVPYEVMSELQQLGYDRELKIL